MDICLLLLFAYYKPNANETGLKSTEKLAFPEGSTSACNSAKMLNHT